MTDDFWARVRAAFDAAADAAPGNLETVLLAASGGDAAVRREAMALLALDAGTFLDAGVAFDVDAGLLKTQIAPGTEFNGYRIVRLVGRGGMGEVYEALRIGADYQKRFAIKVLGAGATGNEAVRRFERERRILARLEHRNIASLLDGGLLQDDRPFLVMEFVEGERITDWCTSHRLTLDARLVLFRQICGAVSYAHRNLIVHRDLKPSNIFVGTDGTVKLLDFGIAKVLDPETGSGAAETATRPEAVALTPEYAAPEQLAGGTVTTATDVYALGLLLYELLTGSRPFASATRSVPELTRLVLTTDPPMPSATVNPERLGADASTTSRHLRGDLDAIVLKALRTEPADRYGTVDELVDDLRRHEEGLPVAAMRGHRGYRLSKFVRRNRGALVALAIVIVAVATGAISTWREARRTEVQRARAEATNRFLTDMLSSVDPAAAGKEVPMVQVLDSAASRIARDTTMAPEIEASLRSAIGASYQSLGKYAAAEPHLRRALDLRSRRSDDPVSLAQAMRDLGLLHDARGEYPAADTLYQRALSVLPRHGDASVTGMATDLLAQRARIQSLDGNLPGAATILRQVVSLEEAQYGAGSREVAVALSQLGVTLAQQHTFAPAESVTRAALGIFRRVHQPPHPDIGKTLGRLATVLEFSGQRLPADSAYRESLSMLAATLGADHPDVAWIRYNYAGFLLDGKDFSGAIREADSVLRLRGGTIPETHNTIAGSIQLRGFALSGLGDHAGAERSLRESLALRRKYLPAIHWLVGSSESVLGEELLHGGSHAEALQLLVDGCRIVTAALGPGHPNSRKSLERLTNAGGSAASCR